MTTKPYSPPPQGDDHINPSYEDCFKQSEGALKEITIEAVRRVFDLSGLEIYVLMEADPSFETSKRTPTGEFVLIEEEAQTWSKDVKGKGWWGGDGDRGYCKVTLKK